MNGVLIAAIVGLGMVACNEATPPSSPASSTPSSAQSSLATSSEPRDSQVAQLSFDAVDANRDGVITLNEALTVPALDFSSADTDRSGTLTRAEFAAAMAKVQQQPGG